MKRNIILALLILLLAGGWWYTQKSSAYVLPLEAGDSVASWDFQGAREGNPELETEVQEEITRLESLLGGDQSGANDDPTDYTIYVSIAGQYESLGNGEKAREYLEKALAIDSVQTGLAWHNLGSLLSRLGAYNTARVAFAHAAEAQPQVVAYHLASINFLMSHFADDVPTIDAAVNNAVTVMLEDPAILQVKAQWMEQSGRPKEAIAVYEMMKTKMPIETHETLDSEIRRLQAL